jgi:antitoxin MazE
MKGVVKKWGNSAAVRIPASILQAAHIAVDEAVDVRQEAGRIVIEPILEKSYDIDELVNGITAKNIHEAVDFGGPAGKETW